MNILISDKLGIPSKNIDSYSGSSDLVTERFVRFKEMYKRHKAIFKDI